MTVFVPVSRTLPLAPPDVRPAGKADLEAIGRIAYATGFFGESAAKFFPDEALFRHLWVNPYFLDGGAVRLVAPREGEVLGYIVGATSQERYGRALRFTLERQVLPYLLRGRYRRPLGCLPYLARLLLAKTPHAPADAYPAHLHINLLPRARGLGLGQQLLGTYLEALRERCVPGVQLSTTRENAAALRLYEKAGFSVYAEKELPLWTPWLGRPAVHVVMVKDLR